MFGLGTTELMIVMAIVLVFFGAGKLPQIGGALGKGIRDFKQGVKGSDVEVVVEAAPHDEKV